MKVRVPALLICLPVLLAAQTAHLGPEKIRKIEQIISSEMSRNSMPRVSVAIGVGTELRWANGYGMADLENQVPTTSETVLRLASISKPMTASAVLQLVERRKIQLDASIQEYVPQFPAKPWPVTVRQLLGHLGGVRHYRDDEIASTRHYSNRVDPLRIFAGDPLAQEPGTRYLYSTYGFNLLGAAVEMVAGVPFAQYLRDHIFFPAGMESIRDDSVYALIPHRTRGYALAKSGELVNCGLADTSNKIPGGGLIAPASDLVKFAFAFMDDKLVRNSSVDLMLRSQATRDGRLTGYGMGFSVGLLEGRRFAAHSGGQQGTSTHLVFFPAERVALAVLVNREAAPAVALAEQIAGALFEP